MNKKALALIVGGIIILAAIVYFIFIYDYSGTSQTPQTPGQSETAEPVISKSEPQTQSGETISPAEQSRDEAEKLAVYFTERYGSSSNQSDFSNLTDLEVFMTDALKTRTRAFISAERAKTPAESAYQGITTKAAFVEFLTFSEVTGLAEGTVKTKRQEAKADGSVSTYDQSLSIALKKENSQWKVDRADWK